MRRLKFSAIAVLQILILLLSYASDTKAFFRHLCQGEIAIGRIDPIVSVGHPSAHCHGIHGASNMGFETDYNHLLASNCTSCSARQDKSAYWSPYLYFKHANGTLEIVPKSGGLTVYYFTERPADQPKTPLVAFPPGFRMIAGSNFKRQYYNGTENQVQPPNKKTWTEHDKEQQSRAENVLGFTCLHYYNNDKIEDAMGRKHLPTKAFIDTYCVSGLRAEIMFPTCWNGELDSENHADHVAYPTEPRNGPCPAGYDKGRFPALFFETVYMTPQFNGLDGEYIFANGDPTGYGYHGDFINGWEEGVLQAAIDDWNCTHGGPDGRQELCPVLDLKPHDEAVSCKMEIPEVLRNEAVEYVDVLPGNQKIYRGPDYAPMPGQPSQPQDSSSTGDGVIGTGTAIGGVVTSTAASSSPPPVPTYPTVSMSSPPFPANVTTTGQASPVAATGAGSRMTVSWTAYHIHDNYTEAEAVFEVIDIVPTTTVVTVTVVETVTAVPSSNTLLHGPAKRHLLHNHGRIHA